MRKLDELLLLLHGKDGRMIRDVQRTLDTFEYDHSHIEYDEQGCVHVIRQKPVTEIIESESCICLGASFYAAYNLRENFGDMCLSLKGIYKTGDEIAILPKHSLYVFELNGRFGAIGKADDPDLGFQSPIYSTPFELAFYNKRLIRGLSRGQDKNGKRKFVGMSAGYYSLSHIFENYDDEVTMTNKTSEPVFNQTFMLPSPNDEDYKKYQSAIKKLNKYLVARREYLYRSSR